MNYSYPNKENISTDQALSIPIEAVYFLEVFHGTTTAGVNTLPSAAIATRSDALFPCLPTGHLISSSLT